MPLGVGAVVRSDAVLHLVYKADSVHHHTGDHRDDGHDHCKRQPEGHFLFLFAAARRLLPCSPEICILATKGHPKRVDAGVRQVILSHIEEHSKKPDEARERIVRLMGDLPRVELFARQSPEGWDVWGNEVECTAHLPTEETPCCG